MVRHRASACIGSGYCCTKALCLHGVEEHGQMDGPCPSLVWDEKAQRHWCGLVLKGEVANWELAIGEGCCASLNSWRREKLEDRTRISKFF